LNFNVSIIDSQKDVFWDMKQYEVMKNIKKNLHIYFDNRVKKDGNFAYVNFTIENESDYDISHIEYGYQLLDYYGQIVYSNIGSISELIEKKGRRERSFSKYIGDEFPRFPFYCSGYIIFKSGDYLNQKQ